ncbi:MAG: metal ABC transporter ATP-binding protein, partial [Candidatus Eisenbacteria bacterium]|nr:metal ABC transporter ATP-binding protein [Candidatus Eisenbacteria bacterium]
MEPVIVFKNLSFSYGSFPVLQNIDLTIERGEFLGVVGPNAGGKSTLLKIALGLLEPSSGSVTVLGRRASQGREAIGYVPQRATAVRDFPISVEETVLLGRLSATHLIGGYRQEDRAAAELAMNEAQILDIRSRPLGNLSGGQFQRVLIARALAGEPKILMFDEPTANIDPHVE